MPSKEAVARAIKLLQAEFDRTGPLIGQVLNDIEPGTQCVNKACGELAYEVVENDEFCSDHARMAREALEYEASLRDR